MKNDPDPNQDAIKLAAEQAIHAAGDVQSNPEPAVPKPRRRGPAKAKAPVETEAEDRKARKYLAGIKRQRTVWGRRKVVVDDLHYVIEMGADGVRVTEKGGRQHLVLQWRTLVKLAVPQTEIFDLMVPSLTEILRRAGLNRPAGAPAPPAADLPNLSGL